MQIFNIKKILIPILFFVLFIIPKPSLAAGGWYYADTPEAPSAPAYGPFSNESECKTKRNEKIHQQYAQGQVGVEFSNCVSINKDNATIGDVLQEYPEPWPTAAELVGGENTIYNGAPADGTGATNVQSVTTYWIMFHSKTSGSYSIMSFVSEKSCKDWWNTGDNSDNIIDVLCSTKKPEKPIEEAGNQQKNYYPLAPLPELGQVVMLAPNCVKDALTGELKCSTNTGFGDYLNILIKLFIGICAVLAMIMIVMGGIQYMTSELPSMKSDAKGTISRAILGLLLALASYAILNTLNPNLLQIGLTNLDTANVSDTGGFTEDTIGSTNSAGGFVSGTNFPEKIKAIRPDIYCPGSGGASVVPQIVESFKGKVTYVLGGHGSVGPKTSDGKDTVGMDCVDFSNAVRECAGLAPTSYACDDGEQIRNTWGDSASITSTGAKTISSSEIQFKPGDVLAWPKQWDTYDSPDSLNSGHQMIYVSPGVMAEASPDAGSLPRYSPGEGAKTNNRFYALPRYSNAIKCVKTFTTAYSGGTSSSSQTTNISSDNASVTFKFNAGLEAVIKNYQNNLSYFITVQKTGSNSPKTMQLVQKSTYFNLSDNGIELTTTPTKYKITIVQGKTSPKTLISGYLTLNK
jgi:hypothetical protein